MIFFELLPYVFSIVVAIISAYVGYLLGLKSQRTQSLRKFVVDTVRARYPALYSEINKNIGLLDDFLEDPLEYFDFPQLDQIYDAGLDKFMKRYHTDLFLCIDYLRKEITPKLYELHSIVGESIKKMYDNWNSALYKTLPMEVSKESTKIARDLLKSINPNYVLEDLLNDRKDAIRKKVEACIIDHTAHIYQEKKMRVPIVIKSLDTESVDYDKIFNSLLRTAKPEINWILMLHTKLQKQTNKKVKLELLPLLQKYISNPI